MNTVNDIQQLKSHFASQGVITWMGVRPQRGAAIQDLSQAMLEQGRGLLGDRAGAHPNGKRQITLIQDEYISMLAQWTGRTELHARQLRRNIAVRGVNLNALVGMQVRLGSEVILEITGLCHPCHKLEQQLGYGVYNALRGHGGLTARVLSGGKIILGDAVIPVTG